ncbi:uncharacterized protein LOC120758146 [Hirundo rustica]|uniref:uncharacterized protein LOC120758146 n=1 Tax=Hirundo rustica TaxID=43150 RepID=UPI00267263B6|nr:uncharacterized protein LOC120758146 [Hirundo rustica]
MAIRGCGYGAHPHGRQRHAAQRRAPLPAGRLCPVRGGERRTSGDSTEVNPKEGRGAATRSPPGTLHNDGSGRAELGSGAPPVGADTRRGTGAASAPSPRAFSSRAATDQRRDGKEGAGTAHDRHPTHARRSGARPARERRPHTHRRLWRAAGLGVDGRSAVIEAGILDVNEKHVEDWALWCSGHSVKPSPSLILPLAREQPEARRAERRSHKPTLEQSHQKS